MSTTDDITSDDDASPVTPSHPSSNLRWILGIGGGAIGGVFMGVPCFDRFPLGAFLLLAAGAIVGAAVPRAGSLAGLGAIVAMVVWNMTRSDASFLLCPLMGGGVGLVWSIAAWARPRKRHEQASPPNQEAIAEQQRDRLQLGCASLVAGVLIGVAFGFMIGGPVLVAGPVFGIVVGGSIFIGLVLSAYLSRRR
jgi:hypothetical protein